MSALIGIGLDIVRHGVITAHACPIIVGSSRAEDAIVEWWRGHVGEPTIPSKVPDALIRATHPDPNVHIVVHTRIGMTQTASYRRDVSLIPTGTSIVLRLHGESFIEVLIGVVVVKRGTHRLDPLGVPGCVAT